MQGSCQRPDAAQRPSSAILVRFVIGSHHVIAFACPLFQAVASSIGGGRDDDALIPGDRQGSHEVRRFHSASVEPATISATVTVMSTTIWSTRMPTSFERNGSLRVL